MLEFAEVLRNRRLERGMTQEDVAFKAGVSPSTVSLLERGINQNPLVDVLEAVLNAVDLELYVRDKD